MGKLNGVTLDEQMHLLVKGYNFNLPKFKTITRDTTPHQLNCYITFWKGYMTCSLLNE